MHAPSSNPLVATCAELLATAETTRQPVVTLTDTYPTLTLVDAYGIQQTNISRRVTRGARVLGHKVGMTARTMQELFGVNEPDYGHLLDTMMHEERRPFDLSELIDPQIEVEPAFLLKKRLMGPGITIEDVLAATDYISTCFEVIDSRIIDWKIKIQDTVADNGSSARVVLGSKRVKPGDLELEDLETVLELDGKPVATGNTSAILGHPANGVAWLANTLSRFGTALEAGHLILPGTCTRCFRIAGHRTVTGRIAEMGDVSLTLENAPSIVKSTS